MYLTHDLDEIIDGSAPAIGDNEGFCFRLTGDDFESRWICTATVYLTDNDRDTVTVVGPFHVPSTTSVSIVGGTGLYAGASGRLEISLVDGVLPPNNTLAYYYDFYFDFYDS